LHCSHLQKCIHVWHLTSRMNASAWTLFCYIWAINMITKMHLSVVIFCGTRKSSKKLNFLLRRSLEGNCVSPEASNYISRSKRHLYRLSTTRSDYFCLFVYCTTNWPTCKYCSTDRIFFIVLFSIKYLDKLRCFLTGIWD
jgi:hypothetical protein